MRLAIPLILFAALAAVSAQEKDNRLHADGPKGWGLQQAEIKDPKLPRVLLMGDSILNGYRATVAKQLEGKANVDAWVNPFCQSSYGLHEKIRVVLTNATYAVIHFNMGLHGWPKGRIPEGQFVPLTQKLVQTFQQNAPGAALIWASSTPVTVKGQPDKLDPDINPVIVEHNAMAAQVMRENKIPINDLYTLMVSKLNLARGDQFHWKSEASALQGKAVAEIVGKYLHTSAAELKSPDGKIAVTFHVRESGEQKGCVSRTLEIPLAFFAPAKQYRAFIYADGATRTSVRLSERVVDGRAVLKADMAANGGYAARLAPVNSQRSY